MTPIFPQPGHSYQLKPLGLKTIADPVIATVDRINLSGNVLYEWETGCDIDQHAECRLSDFVLMIDKEVDVPAEGGAT